MLHMVATMMFLGAGMFALAVIAAMLIDNLPKIQRALGLRPAIPPLPAVAGRVRVVRSPRLTPLPTVRSRAAA
jgi:hypothetical protein